MNYGKARKLSSCSFKSLCKIFPNISDLPLVLPSCTSDTWLSPLLSLPNRSEGGFRQPSCFPSLCLSPLFPILHFISCNYLIIPAFVTHRASHLLLLLPASIFSTHPSYFLYLHLSVRSLKVTVQLLIVRGHYGADDRGRLFCPPWVSYIIGKQILIIPPRKKGLCWGEKGHYLVPSCAVFRGLCVPWMERACLESKLTQNTAWDVEASIANIADRKRLAGVLMQEFYMSRAKQQGPDGWFWTKLESTRLFRAIFSSWTCCYCATKLDNVIYYIFDTIM